MNTDPLRSINWYSNHNGRDCFGISLANLLLFQGDADTAQQVQTNYQHSQFRVYNGFVAPVASRAGVGWVEGRNREERHRRRSSSGKEGGKS